MPKGEPKSWGAPRFFNDRMVIRDTIEELITWADLDQVFSVLVGGCKSNQWVGATTIHAGKTLGKKVPVDWREGKALLESQHAADCGKDHGIETYELVLNPKVKAKAFDYAGLATHEINEKTDFIW